MALSDIMSTAGFRLLVSDSPPISESRADYEKIPWAPVGLVSDLGNLGGAFSEKTFTPIRGKKVIPRLTTSDNGEVQIVFAYTSGSDQGHSIIESMVGRRLSFCVESTSWWCRYFQALVKSAPITLGTVNNIVTVACTLRITEAEIVLAPTPWWFGIDPLEPPGLDHNYWDPTVTLDPRITFTRNSNASRWNHYGVLEVVPPGVARAHAYADHDPETYATSDTRISIGYGSRTFAVDYQYQLGAVVRATYDDNNYVIGRVTASDGVATTLSVLRAVGSGSYDSWHVIGVLGFWGEAQRTNFTRNNTMQGVTVGTIGAGGSLPEYWAYNLGPLSLDVLGIGVESGIEYVDVRLYGTAGAQTYANIRFESGTAIPAAPGQTWTTSAFCRALSSAGVNNIFESIYYRNSLGNSIEANSAIHDGTAENLRESRGSFTMAASDGEVAFVSSGVQIGFASAAEIDVTLRIGLPQIELGGNASSPIKTNGVAASRASDFPQIAGSPFFGWYNLAEGTLISEYVLGDSPLPNSSAARIMGSAGNEIRHISASSVSVGGYSFIMKSSIPQGSVPAGIAAEPRQHIRLASCYKAGEHKASRNGGAVSVALAQTEIPDVNRIVLGDGNFFSHLLELKYSRKSLSDEQVQLLAKIPGTP